MPGRLVKLDVLLKDFKKEEFKVADIPSHYTPRNLDKWKNKGWKFANGKKLSIFYQKTTLKPGIRESVIVGKEDVAVYWYWDCFTFLNNKAVFSSKNYRRASIHSAEWQEIQRKLLEKIRELFIENN